MDSARDAIKDRFCGTYASFSDYAEELADESLHDAPESLKNYFDYDSYARDLKLGGDFFAVEVSEGVAVFHG